MSGVDSENTIEKLREYFEQFELPNMIFTDNRFQFTFADLKLLCKVDGIIHETSASYRHATNDIVENFVGSFKSELLKALTDSNDKFVKTVTFINRFSNEIRLSKCVPKTS